MEWQDEGIVLSTRKQGEAHVILEVLTQNHGRHLGLVRGGASRKQKPQLQQGNRLKLTWRARLDEHLGNFTIEALEMRSARVMENREALYALCLFSQMLSLLPEREPQDDLYPFSDALISTLCEGEPTINWLSAYAWFELKLLASLGFSIDLSQCAATGSRDDLRYVSPRTGRAVCLTAGEPYKDKLLILPNIFNKVNIASKPENMLTREKSTSEDILNALKLTGYFLRRDVFEMRGKEMPFERDKIIAILT